MNEIMNGAIGGYAERCVVDDRGSKTVEENIDLKIASLQREIQRLEESKASLAPLMKMKIRDIREAMSY